MTQATLLPYSSLAQSIATGEIYEHYKGFQYKVLSVARYSETLEELVVYQVLYGEKDVWVRPLSMFVETITFKEEARPRFRLRPQKQ